MLKNTLVSKILSQFSHLTLRWKIYFSLAAILLPVFALTLFVQQQATKPLLQEEVRQVGISVCRSLATDITAFHLINQPEPLETKLVEMTWLQPSIVRLDVIEKNETTVKLVASNLIEETPSDLSILPFSDQVITQLKTDETRNYWDILYPIKGKSQKHILGYLHAEISLQLVNHVVGIFSKLAFLGALLTMILLIGLLSYYLRVMIENEAKLRQVQSTNIELTTQLNETQERLFLNEKLAIMGQLTASFAHEIGTPLNSLSGHLQLLLDSVKNKSEQERIHIINSQVSRIEEIVKNFLASTHTPTQQKQLVDIAALIHRITDLVSPRLQKLKINLSIFVDPHIEPIRIVPTDLEQVLLNLTNNAIDALESSLIGNRQLKYKVDCLTAETGKCLQIKIQDTGEGIEKNTFKQILKPFFTTKARGKGTGLGLPISQRLVKKYGGKLEIDSALGKGTTITVSLPYVE